MTRASKPLRPALERMIALLKQESLALKQADMPALDRLLPRKSALLARLEATMFSQDPLEKKLVQQVQQLAARNARLFEAALQGLNDARALIERYKTRQGDQTYTRNGARHVVDPPVGSLEKRA